MVTRERGEACGVFSVECGVFSVVCGRMAPCMWHTAHTARACLHSTLPTFRSSFENTSPCDGASRPCSIDCLERGVAKL